MTSAPWHFLVVATAGWMNRQQQQVIEYLRTENQAGLGEEGPISDPFGLQTPSAYGGVVLGL